jgi:hypothetical protein
MANALILGKTGSGGGAGGFSLNYDATTPLRSVDVGGPDQEQRYATTEVLKKFMHINVLSVFKGWQISSRSRSRIQATI